MDYKNNILDFLKENEIENLNIINFIENYPIHFIERVGNSILVKGTSDRNWVYISSNSEEELEIIKNRLDINDKNFAIIEDWMIPIITKGTKIKWKMATMRLILPSEIQIFEPKNKVEDLKINDAEFIYDNSHYKDYISIPYIIDRITNGESSCIRYRNNPIGWAVTQDDGALGFLHVLPEYRKNGYARDIMVDLIKKVRAKSKIPFVHIEESNEKSMNLALSLGFTKDKVVNWFELG